MIFNYLQEYKMVNYNIAKSEVRYSIEEQWIPQSGQG